MHHWFLCARDVMWFIVAFGPLALSVMGAIKSHERVNGMTGMDDLFVAFVWQAILLGSLYGGFIK